MLEKTGVYIIENTNTNKYYIGSTAVNFKSRFKAHLSKLKSNSHHSKKLQKSFNKHGEDAFKFRVLEICDFDIVREKEQEWIDSMIPFYNMTLVVDTPHNWSKESRIALSLAQGGRQIDICDLDGNLVKTVDLQREAAEFVGGDQSKVWRCLQGITYKHRGYRFKYSREDFVHNPKPRCIGGHKGKKHSEEWKASVGYKMARSKFKGTLEVYCESELVGTYLSIKEAKEGLKGNLRTTGITQAIKSGKLYHNYKFIKKPLVADLNESGIERGFKEN